MTAENRKAGPAGIDAASIRAIALAWKDEDGALLPSLHAVNDRFGYVDETAILVVAEVLNLSRAEVHGVVTFYRDFRRAPSRRHVVKLCRAEACQALGAERLAREVEAMGASLADVTIEPVYCLGNCALGPAALVDGKLHGRLDTAKLKALISS